MRVTEMARQQEEYSVQEAEWYRAPDPPWHSPGTLPLKRQARQSPINASDAASAPEPISPPHSPGSGSTLQRSDSKLKKSKTKRHAEDSPVLAVVEA